MGTQSAPLRLARDELGDTRHVCALFDGVDEANAVLQPFILEGLGRGDQVIHVVENRDRYSDGLGQRADVSAAVESGQLLIEGWDQAYLLDGHFRASRMLAYLRQLLHEGAALGYPGVRMIGDMEWAQDGVPGIDELIAYELEVDSLLRSPNDAIVCAYDLRRHRAGRIAMILAAHRAVFVDGRLRPTEAASQRLSARDRIVSAASRLFTENGIRATGVDALIASAGVAKATFYRHFPSKDDLVVAWLKDPRTRWFDRVRARAESHTDSRSEIIPEFFTAVAAWLEAEDFHGCPYLNTPVEITDPTHPATRVVREYLDEIEHYLQDTVAAAGYRDFKRLGTMLQALLAGAIALGVAHRTNAFALTARDAAAQLLASAERVGADEAHADRMPKKNNG